MAGIIDIMNRARSLRQETALNSITPERAGGIMYDTLDYINQSQLQAANPLVISKIYDSVASMEADADPVSDLTGKALKPGQVVVIVTGDPDDPDDSVIYRYNGTEEGVSSWTAVGKLGGVAPYLEGYLYVGVATPATDPDTANITQKVFYRSTEPGTYTDFGGLVVNDGEVCNLKWNGSAWSKEVTGEATAAQLSALGQELSEETQVSITRTYTDLFFSISQTTLAAGTAGYKVYYIPVSGAGRYRIVANARATKYIFNVGFATTTPSAGVVVSSVEEWGAQNGVDRVYEVAGAGYIYLCLYYEYVPGTNISAYLLSSRLDGIEGDISALNAATTKLTNDFKEVDISLPNQVYENLLRNEYSYWDASGVMGASSFYDCTNKIKITDIPNASSNGIKLLSGMAKGSSSIPSVLFFDADGAFISSLSQTYSGGSTIAVVDIPANAVYVAFNKERGGEYYGLSIDGLIINQLNGKISDTETKVGWVGEYDVPVTASGIKYFIYKYFKAGQDVRITITGPDAILINGNMSVVFASGQTIPIKTKAGVYTGIVPTSTNQILFRAYAAAVGGAGTIHIKVEIVGQVQQPTFPKISGAMISIIDDDTLDPTSVAAFHDACENMGIKGTFACLTKQLETYATLKDLLKGYEREGHNIVIHAYNQVNAFRSQKKLRFTVSGVTSVSNGSEYTYIDADGNTSQATLLDNHDITAGSGWVDLVFYDNMKAPLSQSGTLTKASGSGDATIAYSAYVEGVFRDIEVATDQLVHGMQDLQEAGFTDFRHWVTPYGAHDAELQELAQKVGLDCLVSIANDAVVKKDSSANRFYIPRYGLNPTSNVATLKGKIDNAVANDGWILFGTHFYNGWDATAIQNVFNEIVTYAKNAGMKFVTLGEGVRIYNPVFDYNDTF